MSVSLDIETILPQYNKNFNYVERKLQYLNWLQWIRDFHTNKNQKRLINNDSTLKILYFFDKSEFKKELKRFWWRAAGLMMHELIQSSEIWKSLDFGHEKIHKNRHSSYLESFEIQMKILQRDGSHGRQKFNVGLRVIYSRNRFSTVSVARLESIMPDALSGGPWSPI